ncbi:MAG: hypothetical protein KGZ39_04330 [Simkania sp.]|nr:hypothetical protein [Simkania sp.]
MSTVLASVPKKKVDLRNSVTSSLKKALAEENACYVLITCKEAAEDGQMQVEMEYEGDACLAAYLLESAQGLIEESF